MTVLLIAWPAWLILAGLVWTLGAMIGTGLVKSLLDTL